MPEFTYVLYSSSSYPEDGYYEKILKYFDNKEEAFESLIKRDLNEGLHMYQDGFIRVFENDKFYEKEDKNNKDKSDNKDKIKKYYTKNGFILDMDEKNIYYCKDNNKELVNKNSDYLTKFKQVENLSNELNKLYEEHYDLCIIKYRNKEIKHPVLRKYVLDKYIYLSNYPFQEDSIEKNESKLSSILDDIIKRQNEIQHEIHCLSKKIQ